MNERLASEGTALGGPHIGISFANSQGQDFRSFTIPGASASTAGVACKQGGDWVVAATASAPGHNQATYAQAGAEMPKTVRESIAGMISGSPYDAAAERAARDRGWK